MKTRFTLINVQSRFCAGITREPSFSIIVDKQQAQGEVRLPVGRIKY
jgi:hypothetical protein